MMNANEAPVEPGTIKHTLTKKTRNSTIIRKIPLKCQTTWLSSNQCSEIYGITIVKKNMPTKHQ